MHEPKLSEPLAELPPDAILNAGLLLEPLNVTVVSAVVPNCVTPVENENGVSATADVTVPLAANVVFEATPSTWPEDGAALAAWVGDGVTDPLAQPADTTTTDASASVLKRRLFT